MVSASPHEYKKHRIFLCSSWTRFLTSPSWCNDWFCGPDCAALTSARHHTTNPGVVSRREVQQEEVEHETYDDPRAQNTPPPGMRPGVLQDPGPPWSRQSRSVTWLPGLPRSLWCQCRMTGSTLQFLLQQSLLARAEEEEKAREEAEVRELKEKVARVMQWPAEKVKEVARRDNFHLSPNLSDLEHGLRPRRPLRGSQEEEGEEEEVEEEEEENQVPVWVPGQLLLMTPLRFSLNWFACRCLGVA